MKKIKIIFTSFLICLCICASVSTFGYGAFVFDDNANEEVKVGVSLGDLNNFVKTVTFNANGKLFENDSEEFKLKIGKNLIIKAEDYPKIKTGEIVNYWYTEDGTITIFDPETPIENDITLYASYI